jgi:hypothetical protein
MADTQEAALLHQRATFWLFQELLREGIVPMVPASPGSGVDATLRGTDGTYRDLLVRPSSDEHFPLAFHVDGLEPGPRLLVVCVAWALTPVQAWIIPSVDFAREATTTVDISRLDLESIAADGSGKLKQGLSRYRNAWRLLTEVAVREFTP